MPRPVQSPAFGLLSLFTAKDGGIGPWSLEDAFRATVDAQPLLGFGFRSTRTVSLAAVTLNAGLGGAAGWFRLGDEAAGIAAGFRVASDELWRVIAFGFTSTTVNGSVGIQAGWDFAAIGGVGGDSFPIALTETNGAGVTAPGRRATGALCGFWAGPNQGPALFFPNWSPGVTDADVVCCLEIERYRL